jgi:hypothetical protein
MNLRDTIKRILKEELGDSAPNAKRESKLLKKLLKSKSYDGLCGIRFSFDISEDRVGGAYLMFSSEWYMSYEDSEELNKKLLHIQVVKKDFGRAAKQMLGLENLYVGSELENPKNCSGLS